jgi:hypothetical protein
VHRTSPAIKTTNNEIQETLSSLHGTPYIQRATSVATHTVPLASNSELSGQQANREVEKATSLKFDANPYLTQANISRFGQTSVTPQPRFDTTPIGYKTYLSS